MQTRIYFTREKTEQPDSNDRMERSSRLQQFEEMLRDHADDRELASVMVIGRASESVSETAFSPHDSDASSVDDLILTIAPIARKQFYLISPQIMQNLPLDADIYRIPPSVLIRWIEKGDIKTQKGLEIPIDWLAMSIVHGLVSGGYWMGMQWDKAMSDGWTLTNSTAAAISMLPLAIGTYYPLAIMRFRYSNGRWPTYTERNTIWGNALQVGVTVTFNAIGAITGYNIAEDQHWLGSAGFSTAAAIADWAKSAAVTSSGSLVGMTLSDAILEYLRETPRISAEVERALYALGVENADELADFARHGREKLDNLIASRAEASYIDVPKPKVCESLWLYLGKAPYRFITADRTWLGVSALLSHFAWTTWRIANPLGRALTTVVAAPITWLTFWAPGAIAEGVKNSDCCKPQALPQFEPLDLEPPADDDPDHKPRAAVYETEVEAVTPRYSDGSDQEEDKDGDALLTSSNSRRL